MIYKNNERLREYLDRGAAGESASPRPSAGQSLTMPRS